MGEKLTSTLFILDVADLFNGGCLKLVGRHAQAHPQFESSYISLLWSFKVALPLDFSLDQTET